jgi:hypothetical protein
MAKAKSSKKRTKTAKKHIIRDASGGEDRKSARKYRRGGRIEAYTWGEVSGKGSNWPF